MEYDERFNDYAEMIVNHPNYEGLFYERDRNGIINWVVTGKSQNGKTRQTWWDAKCEENDIPIQSGCYATIARIIHPTGKHVCQCCGESRSIFYEYPTVRTVKYLNDILEIDIDPENDAERSEFTIKELLEEYCDSIEKARTIAAHLNLSVPNTVGDLINSIYRELVDKNSNLFSPGVMSNSPDRFDGFHSYGVCCRSIKDKGRHKDNLKTYMQDRRAYEEWSDGDYNLANRLMGEFQKQAPMQCPICGRIEKMSADHIGPISLGFCHSKNFAPMCSSCNSTKNNRFSKSDVDTLISLENNGEQVISWHSKFIWDLVKNQIDDDNDAKKASSIMAKCHQNVLNILALIHNAVGKEFLMRYLHPDYSMVDYRFENFDLKHLDLMTIIPSAIDNKNKRKNQMRYVKIAFESLESFLAKPNRKNQMLIDENSSELYPILTAIREGDNEEAHKKLKELIEAVALKIYNNEGGI